MRDVTLSASEVLETAGADPERSLELGRAFLMEGGAPSRDLSIVYRGMSIALRLLGRFDESIEMAERARVVAEAVGDDELQLLAIVTRVSPMVVLGESAEALDMIDDASPLATTPYLQSRLSYQRGVVWGFMGEPVRAIEAFAAALPTFREAGDSEMILGALRGLGQHELATGDLARAEHDLGEALSIAVHRAEEPHISGIEHSLGLLASYRGDITKALRLLLESDEIYMRLTGSPTPQHVARSEVLLSAGLFREAHELATRVAEHHRSAGDPEHLANALFVAAKAALFAGALEEALATGNEAAKVYEDRQRPGPAVEARQIVIEARYGIEGASDGLQKEATEVAVALEAEKHMVSAFQARLLAGRIAIDLGDLDRAVGWLGPVSQTVSGPVELRVQSRLATARLRRLAGNTRGSDAAVRSGLRLIDEYQAALGATDLRMGLERHGAELGAIGLDLALGSRDPRRLLRWMELTRARALRYRPVVPDDDEEIRETLGRLRQVEAELRGSEQRGDPSLERERRTLQEQIRNADRLKRAGGRLEGSFDVDSLMAELDNRSLLEIAIHDGRLVGVNASGGRARWLELGESEPVMQEVGHVRFGMRRAARRGRPVDVESLERLDRLLFDRVDLSDDGVVIIVPPPPLMAAPWSALPSLRGRSLTISPSAEMWWRAHRSESSKGQVLVAGGPDLGFAGAEVEAVRSLYPSPTVVPPDAKVEDVRSGLAGAMTAHIVSHATFQVENPMFSSLRLGDGDLNVYDIERLDDPPGVVVLSACDSGYTETRAGDELTGLTSALLSMGTRSVVASVGLVPDSVATSALMVRLHEGLIRGLEPAAALAAARARSSDDPADFIAAASFICVGA